MESPVNILLRESLILSLNFLSRDWATISAALPRGQRMIGTTPEGGLGWSGGEGEVCGDWPVVTKTEKRHSTMESQILSISVSNASGLFKAISERGARDGVSEEGRDGWREGEREGWSEWGMDGVSEEGREGGEWVITVIGNVTSHLISENEEIVF